MYQPPEGYPHHPHPQRIEQAMRDIRDTYDSTEGANFDMKEPHLYHTSCHTIACLAGWWQLSQISLYDARTNNQYYVLNPKGTLYDYGDGAYGFARFVGFRNYDCLCDWSAAYPHIWGNPNGANMFANLNAYQKDGDKTIPDFHDILDHWLAVAGRIRQALVPRMPEGIQTIQPRHL